MIDKICGLIIAAALVTVVYTAIQYPLPEEDFEVPERYVPCSSDTECELIHGAEPIGEKL